MEQRFEDWVANLKWDWCISRQRYFGVPLPFWYSKRAGEEGRVIAAHPDDLPVNPLVTPPRGYAMDEVEPDPDVMDTWATSSLTPQINAGGVTAQLSQDAGRFGKVFPADLRPQAHEIIRSWAFYTVAKAFLHTGQAPFRALAISGWCLANDNSKMSKSKGNIIHPEALLDRFGTDVVRYWTATARLGRDSAYSEDVLKVGKRLVTKLVNAARFCAPQLAEFDGQDAPAWQDVTDGHIHCAIDLWLLAKLSKVVGTATNHFQAYDYTDALEVTERFFFGDFCDNYLELVKGRVYGEVGDAAAKRSAQLTLGHALLAILQLFAPFLPFATEDTLHEVLPKTAAKLVSVHARGGWPRHDHLPVKEEALAAGELAIEALARVRAAKSERGVSIKAPLAKVTIAHAGAALPQNLLDDLRQTVSAVELVSVSATETLVTAEWPG